MVVFPNCKINIGLRVTQKRADGYHNIETVFYPVNWCDMLEIIENRSDETPITLTYSGIDIAGKNEDNLIYKAWQIISAKKEVAPIKVHLHKNIPMGAGLGGGSADAAFFINQLNEQFNLGFNEGEKVKIASQLGSDCAFFLNNKAVFGEGKGDEFSEVDLDLGKYYILLVYPGIHSNTKIAYENVVPLKPEQNLKETLLNTDIHHWRDKIFNDFESSIFKKFPEIKLLKEQLYSVGAIYASLSGSGSSVFGIFEKEPTISFQHGYSHFLQKPNQKIL